MRWIKILSIVLILYSLSIGLLIPVPRLPILNETIRNLFYHVPIWFAMLFQFAASLLFALKYLVSNDLKNDIISFESAKIGLFFSVPGILTGSLWAKYTWGTWWTFEDPKLNGVAISILIYVAYLILRNSFNDTNIKARLSAVYNILAFVMMIVFILILPRLSPSLHPGNGGNPAFGKYDLDNTMRLVFYPAIIGWICLSIWLLNIKIKLQKLKQHYYDIH